MYENIGGKIKGLAKWTFIVEAIGSAIAGIVLLAEDDEFIVLGLLLLLVAPLVLWIMSWMLYGFGELIEKTCEIARNTSGTEKKSEAQSKVDNERVRRIEKLRSQGLITEEEYQQAVSKEQ